MRRGSRRLTILDKYSILQGGEAKSVMLTGDRNRQGHHSHHDLVLSPFIFTNDGSKARVVEIRRGCEDERVGEEMFFPSCLTVNNANLVLGLLGNTRLISRLSHLRNRGRRVAVASGDKLTMHAHPLPPLTNSIQRHA